MQRHKRLKHRVWKCSGQNKSKLSEANAAISVFESLTSKKRIFPLKNKNYSQLWTLRLSCQTSSTFSMVSLEFCLCGDLTRIDWISVFKAKAPKLAGHNYCMFPCCGHVSQASVHVRTWAGMTDMCSLQSTICWQSWKLSSRLFGLGSSCQREPLHLERSLSEQCGSNRHQRCPRVLCEWWVDSPGWKVMHYARFLSNALPFPVLFRCFCSCSYAAASSWRFSLVFFTIVVMKSLASSKVLRSGKGDHIATHEEALHFWSRLRAKNYRLPEGIQTTCNLWILSFDTENFSGPNIFWFAGWAASNSLILPLEVSPCYPCKDPLWQMCFPSYLNTKHAKTMAQSIQWCTPPTDWKQGTKDVINFCLHLSKNHTQTGALILEPTNCRNSKMWAVHMQHLILPALIMHSHPCIRGKFQSLSLCQWQGMARLQGRKASPELVQKRPDLV